MAGKADFIKGVLGTNGAQALAKAIERQPELDSALFPRTILAWLNFAASHGFDGTIPGTSYEINFNKNEGVIDSLDNYDGSIEVKGHKYSYKNASVFHLAALIASAIGEEDVKDVSDLNDSDITRLGKSLDQIVMARQATLAFQYEEFQKATNGLFQQAAFKHRPTNKVIPTGPRHDIEMIDPDAYDRGEYEDGFVTHEGKFVNRAQAHKMLHAGQAPQHSWEAVQSEDIFDKGEAGQSLVAALKEKNAQETAEHNAKQAGATQAPSTYGQHRNVYPKGHPFNKSDKTHVCAHGLCTKGIKGDAKFCSAHTPKSEPVKKADLPGLAAAPKAPQPPTAPTASLAPKKGGAGKPSVPKAPAAVGPGGKPAVTPGMGAAAKPAMPGIQAKPKLPGIKVSKSEAETHCSNCGLAQMRGSTFVGCVCFADMAKSVTSEVRPDGYLLHFGKDWDQESIQALLSTVRGE